MFIVSVRRVVTLSCNKKAAFLMKGTKSISRYFHLVKSKLKSRDKKVKIFDSFRISASNYCTSFIHIVYIGEGKKNFFFRGIRIRRPN